MPVGNYRCNIGYSQTVKNAIIDAVVAHGQLVASQDERLTSGDIWCANQTFWMLGSWTARSWETFRRNSKWEWEDWLHDDDRSIFRLSRGDDEPVCGQCNDCTDGLTMPILLRTLNTIAKMQDDEQSPDSEYEYEPWETTESEYLERGLRHKLIQHVADGEYGELTEMAKLLV